MGKLIITGGVAYLCFSKIDSLFLGWVLFCLYIILFVGSWGVLDPGVDSDSDSGD